MKDAKTPPKRLLKTPGPATRDSGESEDSKMGSGSPSVGMYKVALKNKLASGTKRKLLLATHNMGKLREIREILKDLPFEVVCLSDLPQTKGLPDLEEPGMTFEGNALIKAMTWGKRTGILTIAEDSGLCVDALGGRPGVFSARYAPGTDKDRCEKLLEEMKGVPCDKRTASFRAVVAIYDPANDKVRTVEGVFAGWIGPVMVGENGFGFDPVFCGELCAGKTNAELTREEKNSVSHRGKAFRAAAWQLVVEF